MHERKARLSGCHKKEARKGPLRHDLSGRTDAGDVRMAAPWLPFRSSG
ncbi:hypothetical protein DESPIG_03108 [Desulfovibrio piger ATCC 29098]|uniref:Uncharacterized protein n=1 Tax=Desulfovibrio piger ATCC 29098 TaxID=411464 RepID=B6WYC7_9BACT|nr:hypothetical protein DESPIG_03108 [Desulfovibrio piger ATCC 29098]